MEGPMGFSNLDKVGVLTSGFEIIGTMITAYNHSYYVNHYEKYGLITEKNFHEKHLCSGTLTQLIMKR